MADNPQITSSIVAVVGASFVSPTGAKSYVSGDLIADSATAATVNANVTPGTAGIMVLPVARVPDATASIIKLRVKTTDPAFAGKNVRVHLYKDRPTVSNGDDAAYLTTESNYIGYADVLLDRHFTDYEKGLGVPASGTVWNVDPSAGTVNIFSVIECRDTVTGAASKTWSVVAEVFQN